VQTAARALLQGVAAVAYSTGVPPGIRPKRSVQALHNLIRK